MIRNAKSGNGSEVAVQAADGTHTQELKAKVHSRVLATMNFVEALRMPADELHRECARRVDTLLDEQRCPLSAPERKELVLGVMDEIFGLGPIEEFLRDSSISDILVNGPKRVYIERHGCLERTDVEFRDDAHLMQVIQRIASNVGRRIDESSPMLDARLEDGSRVNAIIAPLSLCGPTLSIRRFGAEPIGAERLLEFGTLTEDMLSFIDACIRCKSNVLISGGTGAGKTTLLNVLSRCIPEGERVVTIEDAAELQLQREHVVTLETRPPNIEGQGEVTQRALLRNSLRMRPDRIIIGEVRGEETLDMLQAMNTGHEGSMTTVHANNPRDALRRIENMVGMAGLNYPIRATREQIASALHLVMHVSRLAGGRRKVTSIMEITGMEGDAICIQEIFRFNRTGLGKDGHAIGHFEACGVRPRILDRLRDEGVSMPDTMFRRRKLSERSPKQ